MLEDAHDVFPDVGLVVVRVAGRKQGNPAAGLLRCDGLGGDGALVLSRLRRVRGAYGGSRASRCTPSTVSSAALAASMRSQRWRAERRPASPRDFRRHPSSSAPGCEILLPAGDASPTWPAASSAESPRSTRAAGHTGIRHEAHVAQIAVIDDLPVIRLRDPVHLHGPGFVNQIDKVGKAWQRLKHRRQPWQMSYTRSSSANRASSSWNSGLFQSSGWTLRRLEAALLAIDIVGGHVADAGASVYRMSRREVVGDEAGPAASRDAAG